MNLFFGVGAARADGFHEVVSIYQELDLRERVEVSRSQDFEIKISGDIDERQLAQAAELLAHSAGIEEEPLAFSIVKQVPVAGGMAGGSADAAAALLACNQLLETNLSRDRLISESVQLGSDVPFAIMGGTAIGRGRGEKLEPLTLGRPLHFVMIMNSGGLSTPEVYAELDRQREQAGIDPRQVPAPQAPEALIRALADGDVREIAVQISNDLQNAAIALLPELELTLSAAERYGALRAFVSGSGPTVAALVETSEDASALAVALQHANFKAFVVQTDSLGAVLEPAD